MTFWKRLSLQRHLRPERHDAGRIDPPVAGVIVVLDVEEVDGLGHARPVIEFAQIALQGGIVADLPQVALEVAEIDGVETDQGGEEPPIGLGQSCAAEEAPASEFASSQSSVSNRARNASS